MLLVSHSHGLFSHAIVGLFLYHIISVKVVAAKMTRGGNWKRRGIFSNALDG